MPSGASAPPRGIPCGLFGIGFAFPESEIFGAIFCFVDGFSDAVDHFVEVTIREFAVVFECRDSVIDVAAGFVGVTVVEELLDEGDDIGDVLRDARFDIGLCDVDRSHIFV